MEQQIIIRIFIRKLIIFTAIRFLESCITTINKDIYTNDVNTKVGLKNPNKQLETKKNIYFPLKMSLDIINIIWEKLFFSILLTTIPFTVLLFPGPTQKKFSSPRTFNSSSPHTNRSINISTCVSTIFVRKRERRDETDFLTVVKKIPRLTYEIISF